MEKWEWECSVGMGMGGNGNDSMGVVREWEQESHSRTPLIPHSFLAAIASALRASQFRPCLKTSYAYGHVIYNIDLWRGPHRPIM